VQPDGELSGHHAERMGRRPGVLQLRHLSGPLREGGQPHPEGSQAVRAVLRLRREHPVPLGHAGTVFQHYAGLDLPRGSRGPEGHRGRQGDRLYLRRVPEGNGHGEQGLHRDHDRGRRQRPGLPVPHPHLFHHQGLRLERHGEQPPAV